MQMNKKILPIEYILHNFRLNSDYHWFIAVLSTGKHMLHLETFVHYNVKFQGFSILTNSPRGLRVFFPFLLSFSFNLVFFLSSFSSLWISFLWSASSIPSNPGYNYQDYIIFIYFAESQWWWKDAQGVV